MRIPDKTFQRYGHTRQDYIDKLDELIAAEQAKAPQDRKPGQLGKLQQLRVENVGADPQ